MGKKSKTADERKEPARPSTIPDDFIYDPESDAYYPPGEPSNFDAEASYQKTMRVIEECRREWARNPPEDIIIPPGFFAKPETKRKSPKREKDGKRDLFSDIPEAEQADES